MGTGDKDYRSKRQASNSARDVLEAIVRLGHRYGDPSLNFGMRL